MNKPKDDRILESGEIFNSWTIINQIPKENQSRRYYLCKCKCGIEKIRDAYSIKSGKSTQCYECAFKSHGQSKTNTYKIFIGIITRCYNPKVKIYKYYGGRGIGVCDEWRNNYIQFLQDVGDRPEGKQLDRIDNDKGYSKYNCHWVTPKENNAYNKGDIKDDMPGKKFGKWLIIERVKHKPNHWYYLCRCECGKEAIRPGGDLRRGRTTQCLDCKNISHRNWPERYKSVIKQS